MTEQIPNPAAGPARAPLTAAEAIAAAIPTAADIAAQRAGAGGPAVPAAAERSLESQLGHVDHALAALFVEARAPTSADDPYGHARSRAYSDAIGLLKASAKVGHTVAELRGGRSFEHNINVHHSKEEAAGRARQGSRQPVPEDDEVEIPDGWYDDNIHLSDGRVFVHGVGWRHPHRNSGGSNTEQPKPSAPAEPAKPPVRPEPRISTF
jgi:hypothetical protein